jgi:hypothetical protein
MPDFQTSLLREKFVISDKVPADFNDAVPIVAVSNRIMLPLVHRDGQSETLIVRAQNMHTATRMAAHITRSFYDYGPLVSRGSQFNWQEAWDGITKGYEQSWNSNRWISIYHKGRVVYEDGEGERHPFVDIIEQCDAVNKKDYSNSIEIAADAFSKAGKDVNISHDSNVALIMNIGEDEGKCGLIIRSPSKTTTFNFTAKSKGGRKIKISQCLTVAAAFLEGVQLAFFIGMNQKRLKLDLIDSGSPQARQTEDASRKLGRLNGAIAQFENMFKVNYRPDPPDLSKMVTEAEEFAKEILKKEIQAKIDSGELDDGDWVQ